MCYCVLGIHYRDYYIVLCFCWHFEAVVGAAKSKTFLYFFPGSAAYNISRVEKRDISVCLVCSKGREQLRFVVG